MTTAEPFGHIMIAFRAAPSFCLGLGQEELTGVAGVSRQIVMRIEKADGSERKGVLSPVAPGQVYRDAEEI
ncbi:helix-turn-helix domain-containing protein [Agrobacterium sp. 22-3674b3]